MPREAPDPRILKFIRRHHVLTLASIGDTDDERNELWCCNLFYAYTDRFPYPALVFTSGADTLHARHFSQHPEVAGSIVLESRVVGRLQGLQLQGIVRKGDKTAREIYLRRFPYAAVILKELWVLEITRLKYTDNTLGFGTKLNWAAAPGTDFAEQPKR